LSLSNLEAFVRSVQEDSDLTEIQAPVRSDLDDLQLTMVRFFETSLKLLQGVGGHLLAARGKKFRPTVLLLIAKTGSADRDDAVFAASVVEMIHTATLIHDDTIDSSAIRRGMPTLNEMFNDTVATILGDYIYTKAFCELIDRDLPRLVPVVAKTTHRMTIGEVLGIQQKRDPDLTEEDYFELIDEKTASLMSSAARIGAILGGFSDDEVEEMTVFGEELGRAYQVTDDLFDFVGDESELGKGVGSDLTEGKVTLPVIHAIRATSGESCEFVRSLVDRRELSTEERLRLKEILDESGSLEYCRKTALDLADSALGRLSILPEGLYRTALEKAVAYAVHRIH